MKIIKVSAVWCPGCLVMYSIWNKVKEIYKEIEIIEYDYDIDEEEVNNLNVGSILPVTIICDNNMNELERVIGEKTFDEIKEVIEKYEEVI